MLRKGESVPAAEEIARLYNMSISTFRRRCREEGKSYKQIRESCLLELAREWLRSPDIDIEEVALMLGFGDGRSFRRAFKRWTGISPSEFR
jgi:AraC-like DNA-binding protein